MYHLQSVHDLCFNITSTTASVRSVRGCLDILTLYALVIIGSDMHFDYGIDIRIVFEIVSNLIESLPISILNFE